MNETRPSKLQAHLAVPYCVISGVLVVMALIVYGLLRYPSAFALSPVASIVYLVLCVGLLSGYVWLALHRISANVRADTIELRCGGWLGLAAGLCWLIELWAGNLADPASNKLVLLAYRGSTAAVPVLTVMAALYSSWHTRLLRTGIWVGLWSGMVSALITFSGLALIAYSGALTRDPQTIHQVLSSGATGIMAYSVADSLAGAINHLWIGPALGVICGSLGGIIGAAEH